MQKNCLSQSCVGLAQRVVAQELIIPEKLSEGSVIPREVSKAAEENCSALEVHTAAEMCCGKARRGNALEEYILAKEKRDVAKRSSVEEQQSIPEQRKRTVAMSKHGSGEEMIDSVKI